MRRISFLGIDVGTSSCKGILIDEKGKILAQAQARYPRIFNELGIEQSPFELWEGVKKTIGEIIKGVDVEICGVGVSSQGITFIPVDKEGNPLANAISWLDTRATKELEEVISFFSGKEIFSLTGKRAEAYYVLPKLLWLRKHRREIYEKADKFLLVADFVIKKLTRETSTDHTLAGGTLLYDVVRNRWASEIMGKFSISPSKFPPLAWAGNTVGIVQNEETGLKKRTPVVIAGQDQKCAAFASGLKDGIATISLGTASAITTLAHSPLLDDKMRIPLFPYISPGLWVLEGVVSTAGASYEWGRKAIGRESKRLPPIEKISKAPFFLPHLSGASSPLWRKEARGSFRNLSLSTTGEEMLFAILEGVCFEIRRNVEVMEELIGGIKSFIAFGGGTKEEIWREILTNVLGKEVYFPEIREATAYGAGLLAGSSSGFFEQLPKNKGEYLEPDEELKKIFEERYSHYKTLEL
jgi:xylulokinase